MKRAYAILCSTSVLFVSTIASADDLKLVPAGFCSPELLNYCGEQECCEPEADVRITEFFEVIEGDVRMACPLLRDKLGSTDDLESFAAYFETVANDGGSPARAEVICELFATNPVNDADFDVSEEIFIQTAGGDVHNKTLTFDVSGLESQGDRAYTLWCHLNEGDVFGGVLYAEPN
jgi:hypothetical protein